MKTAQTGCRVVRPTHSSSRPESTGRPETIEKPICSAIWTMRSQPLRCMTVALFHAAAAAFEVSYAALMRLLSQKWLKNRME
jgi:hypothetical protein